MIAGIIIGIIAFILLVSNIRVVKQEYVYIIERLGKYKATWESGIHVKIPFIDSITKVISLKEQVMDFAPQSVITKDNVSMLVDSVIFYKIQNPKMYVYGIEDAKTGLENLSATTLRAIMGEMELDETLSSREEINAKMQMALDSATDPWGIRVNRVELKNIEPPDEIEEVMTKQMRAERERRQVKLEAEAHKEAVVLRAVGDKEAKVLAAEAEKEARIAIAQGEAESLYKVYEAEARGLKALKEAGVDESVLKLKGLDTLERVADGNATKIFMPTDLSSVISTLGVAAEAVKDIKGEIKKKDDSYKDDCEPHHVSQVSKDVIKTNKYIESDLGDK